MASILLANHDCAYCIWLSGGLTHVWYHDLTSPYVDIASFILTVTSLVTSLKYLCPNIENEYKLKNVYLPRYSMKSHCTQQSVILVIKVQIRWSGPWATAVGRHWTGRCPHQNTVALGSEPPYLYLKQKKCFSNNRVKVHQIKLM